MSVLFAVKGGIGPQYGVLGFSPLTYSVAETGGTVTLTVSRTGGSYGAVGCTYETVQGTALASTHYTYSVGTLSWADSDTADKTIEITVLNDGVAEGDHVFYVNIYAPTGNATIDNTKQQATVTVTDVTSPSAYQFTASTYTAGEDDGTVQIGVSRTGGLNGSGSIDIDRAGGTAVSGTDYSGGPTWPLSWSSGEGGVKYATITLIDRDGVAQGDLTLNFELNNAQGGSIGSPSTSTLTIIDKDSTSDAGELAFKADSYSVAEDGGSLVVSVGRTGGAAGAVSALVSVSGGTAVEDTDYSLASTTAFRYEAEDAELTGFGIGTYTGASGQVTVLGVDGATGTISQTYTGNNATATIRWRILDEADGTTSFTWELNDVTQGTITLDNNDNSFHNFDFSGISINTGDVISATITGDGGEWIRIDYIEVRLEGSNQVYWGSSDGADKNVTYTIIDRDGENQGNKTISLELISPAGGVTIGSPSTSTVTIVDQDPIDPGTVQFVAATSQVSESQSTHTVTVTRSGGSAGSANANVAIVGGTGVSGTDYTATNPQLLEWADGELGDKTYTLSPIDRDGVQQGNKTVQLSITAGGAGLGTPNAHTITITDDDSVSAIRWATQGTPSYLPAIPGAVGHGMQTVHGSGRGGTGTPTIRRVTNLNASGAGSFVAAIDAHDAGSTPSIIVFEVSGRINSSELWRYDRPNLWIAGQTAPSPGVAITGTYPYASGSDTLIQHLTFAAGDASDGYSNLTNRDGFCVCDAPARFVIGNCMFLHGVDGNIDTYRTPQGLTYWRCLSAQGLFKSWKNANRGGGMLFNDWDNSEVSVIQCAVVHPGALGRAPFTKTKWFGFYNCGVIGQDTYYLSGSDNSGDATAHEWVKNVYLKGHSREDRPNPWIEIGGAGVRKVYFEDNDIDSDLGDILYTNSSSAQISSTPLLVARPDGLIFTDRAKVVDLLYHTCGPWPAVDDHYGGHRKRLLGYLKYRNENRAEDSASLVGQNIDYVVRPNTAYWGAGLIQVETGGWPTMANNTQSYTDPTDPNSIPATDPYTGNPNPGYTKRELYIHSLARAIDNTETYG